MPILANVRHERFAQAIVNGLGVTAAYVEAGFRENTGNAATLKAKQSVKKRIAELLTARQRKNERNDISLESVLADIERACEMAEANGQANVVLGAAQLRAKIAGLLVDKVEHGSVGAFSKCTNEREVLERFVDDSDPHEVRAMLEVMLEAVNERLASEAKLIE